MPEGMRRSTVLRPPITSVWPALWPPWKRTTPSALSVSQSTILPLPSSPHWVPMTTTFFPIRGSDPLAREHVCELPQVEREAGRGSRAAERLPDAVVASAVADRRGMPGGEHGEDRSVLVMIAAQVGEIDVQRLDVRRRRAGERVERIEGVGDGGSVGQLGAGAGEDLLRRSVERREL